MAVTHYEVTAIQQLTNEDAAAKMARVDEHAAALKQADERKAAHEAACALYGIPVTSYPEDLAKAAIKQQNLILGAVANVKGTDKLIARLGLTGKDLGTPPGDVIWAALVSINDPLLYARVTPNTGELIMPAAAA
jgi:hypothetical protein